MRRARINKMETEQIFEVKIKKELEDKLNWFTHNYDKEIGAWLIGKITENKIIIEDFLIPHQEVDCASVDTDGKSLVKLRKEYGDKCKKIIGHWHSHNTMGAFWSLDDESFIEEFSEPREIAVFIVSSKTDRHLIRLEINKPLKVSLDKLDYSIAFDNPKLKKELRKIIKEKVIETESIFSYRDNWEQNNLTDYFKYDKVGELAEIQNKKKIPDLGNHDYWGWR